MAKGGSGRKGGGPGKGGSAGKGGHAGKSGGRSMSKSDAARIQSAGARNQASRTARSGFDERVQSAADRAANTQQQ
jgi:hypothetical protein